MLFIVYYNLLRMFLAIKVFTILMIDYIVVRNMLINLFADFLKKYRLCKSGERTTGVIVSFRTKGDLDGHNQYNSIIEFIAINGSKYCLNAKDAKYVRPEINKRVEIAYSKDNPSNAIINPRSALRMSLFLVLFLLLVVLGVNLGFLVQEYR